MRVDRASGLHYPRIVRFVLPLAAAAVLLASAVAAQERACGAPDACATAEGFVEGPSGPVWRTYELVEGMAVVDGDIAVQVVEGGARSAIRPGSKWKWEDGVIPYEIRAGTDQNVVQGAIDHWHANTDLVLVPHSTEVDYVEFFSGSGCSSWVGRQGGRQEISLAPPCTVGNAVHEIGHAAGLWHEQSRHDRGKYVIVHYENIQSGQGYNFDTYPDGEDYGPYDYGSIMHYPRLAFSSHGLPTIEPLQPGVTIGQRRGLSAGDRSAIAELYGFDPAVTVNSVRLRADMARTPRRSNGRIIIHGALADWVLGPADDPVQFPQSVMPTLNRGLIISVSGAGLESVETMLFPYPRCLQMTATHIRCIGTRSEVADFRLQKRAPRSYRIDVTAPQRSFVPPLDAAPVHVVLSNSGNDWSADLATCMVHGKVVAGCRR